MLCVLCTTQEVGTYNIYIVQTNNDIEADTDTQTHTDLAPTHAAIFEAPHSETHS